LGKPAPRAPVEAEPQAADCLPIVSIGFGFKSARPLTQTAEERLAPLLEWVRDRPYAHLLVEGHTDAKGAEAYNVMLSYSRAQSVMAWLAKSGVRKSQMTALAAGTAQPEDPSLIVSENRMALVRVEGVAPCRHEGPR
jgi:outer membrane protein OmpA-like peptidoglycan-associated protein